VAREEADAGFSPVEARKIKESREHVAIRSNRYMLQYWFCLSAAHRARFRATRARIRADH
jgi:hypothetical protein